MAYPTITDEPRETARGMDVGVPSSVDLVDLKRALVQWKEILTCQRCLAVMSTVRELYLHDDDQRSCSLCSSSPTQKEEGKDETNSLFFQINESHVDGHDSAAADPGRIVWILERLVAAHEAQKEQEVEDKDGTDTVNNDTLESIPKKKAQHEQGGNDGSPTFQSASIDSPREPSVDHNSWLPVSSVTKPGYPLLASWEKPGPRQYDSLDPHFLGPSPMAAGAMGPMKTSGPVFYHYHCNGNDNPQPIAYDDGNLREFFKSRRTTYHHHHHLHRPPEDAAAVNAFEFDASADADSQESMIRIDTTTSCEKKNEPLRWGNQSSVGRMASREDAIHEELVPNTAVPSRSRRRKKMPGKSQSQHRPTYGIDTMIDGSDTEVATGKSYESNAFTTSKARPSYFQRHPSSVSSTTTLHPPLSKVSIPTHPPLNPTWTMPSAAMSYQLLSEQSESGEEWTSSFSLPHTSDFEKILPNRMGPNHGRMQTEDSGEEDGTDPPTQPLLPHTEDFDRIFPDPRRLYNVVTTSHRQNSASTAAEIDRHCFENPEVLQPPFRATFTDGDTNTADQTSPQPRNPIVGKIPMNSADSDQILPGIIIIDPTTNVLTLPETVVHQDPLQEGTSQGGSNNDMDFLRTLSPLTEPLSLLTRDHLTLDTRRGHVTPATGQAIYRRSNDDLCDAARESPNVTLMSASRRIDGRSTDEKATRSKNMDRKAMVTPRNGNDIRCNFRSRKMVHPFSRSALSGSVEVCNRTFQYLNALVNGFGTIGNGDEPIWGDCQLFRDVKEVGHGDAPDKEWLRKAPWWNSMTRSPCDANAMEDRRHLLTGYQCVVISTEIVGEPHFVRELNLAKLQTVVHQENGTESISYSSLTSEQAAFLGGAVGMTIQPITHPFYHHDRSIILVPEEIDGETFDEFFKPLLEGQGISKRKAPSIIYFSWLVDSIAAGMIAPLTLYAVRSCFNDHGH